MKPNPTGSSENWRPLALLIVGVAALLVIVFRLLPVGIRGEFNFAPAGALFLFAGARLRSGLWFAIPFIPVIAVDLYFYQVKGWPIPFFSYVSYVVYLMIGWWLLRRTESPLRIAPLTVAASLQFFLITNFGVWLGHVLRPEQYTMAPFQFANLGGLVQCYEVALPFFRGTFWSDLIFSGAFFAAHALLPRVYFPDEKLAPRFHHRGAIVKFAATIDYSQDKALVEQHRPVHRQYLRSLLESGKLFACGPFTDDSGALIVYEAETAEEAENILRGDPFHAAKVFLKWTIKPWKVVMGNAAMMPA